MSVLSMQFVRREMHSADGRTYIDRVGDHRWLVVVAGIGRSSHWTRSSARTRIRALKAVALATIACIALLVLFAPTARAAGRQCVALGDWNRSQ